MNNRTKNRSVVSQNPKSWILLLGLLPSVLISIPDVAARTFQQDEKIKVPDPERVLIETKDGVELRADWYGGAGGKEAVPVILLHDWDGDRTGLTPLAEFLQKKHGFAVIVPDLRGHGESLTVKGSDEELRRSRFKKAEVASMYEDIDSCRRFLQEKNDLGELNLDMLVIVAVGKTGIQAVNWSIADWNWKPIAGVKQGQNIKALVLIAPRRRFKSVSMDIKAPLLAGRTAALPLLLVWGEDNETAAEEGQSIFSYLEKERTEPDTFADDQERWQKKALFRIAYPSSRDSLELLQENAVNLYRDIATFIEKKVVARQEDYLWQSREIK